RYAELEFMQNEILTITQVCINLVRPSMSCHKIETPEYTSGVRYYIRLKMSGYRKQNPDIPQ
ncbi:hypothetical protein P7K49_017412, partial [Saguinus oedipus]